MIYSLFLQRGAGLNLAPWQLIVQKSRAVTAIMALLLLLVVGVALVSPVVEAQEGAKLVPVATVNINTADAPTLAAALKGVGESRAHEIVRYREAYGPFATPQELMEVKGIGQSTLDANLKLITLE